MGWRELVGTPYVENGDGDSGYDCIGLVRRVIRTECGIALPRDPFAWRAYADTARVVAWPAETRLYDVICFSQGAFGAVNHLGVVVSPCDFLHANVFSGQVVLDRIGRYRNKIKALIRFADDS